MTPACGLARTMQSDIVYPGHGCSQSGPAGGRGCPAAGQPTTLMPSPSDRFAPARPADVHVAQRDSRGRSTYQKAVAGSGVCGRVEIVHEQLGAGLELDDDVRYPGDDDRRCAYWVALCESVCSAWEVQRVLSTAAAATAAWIACESSVTPSPVAPKCRTSTVAACPLTARQDRDAGRGRRAGQQLASGDLTVTVSERVRCISRRLPRSRRCSAAVAPRGRSPASTSRLWPRRRCSSLRIRRANPSRSWGSK